MSVPAHSASATQSEQTLEYLGRYAQRAAIGNARICEINEAEQSVTFRYRDNHGDDYDWGSIEEETIPALEFIDRFLLHVMPYRMTRVRKFGWWSVRKKSVELPRIRVALGMPEPKVADREEEPPEQNEFAGAGDVAIRIVCRECGTLSMVQVEHYPKPSIHRIMKWIIWPERDPDARRPPLPGMEPYLPGGALFLQAMGFT